MSENTEEMMGMKGVDEIENLDVGNAKTEVKQIATSVYDTSMISITMALALTVALAWNDLIKHIMDKFFIRNSGNNFVHYLIYAIFITVIFAVIQNIMKKWIGKDVNPTVQFVVSGTR
jgi:hypothetical protein